MADSRQARDSYLLAEHYLREALCQSAWSPGQLLNLVEIAALLEISPTPVREAASRLVGATALEFRRGQGYFVPDLSSEDVVELYRIVERLVVLNMPRFADGARLATDGRPPCARVMMDWMADALDPSYAARLIRQISGRLAPILGVEGLIMEPSDPGRLLQALVSGDRAAATRVARRYFRARTRAADLLIARWRRMQRIVKKDFE
ncbi:GntR family transcriptional regulator [Sphingobium boeckii]|uniref:DNA-binding GntR family transcriptional regulator n=1 Tax=Sphingobium boeckii TaxID=1082345 RepID=A0A7W9AG20_9SPHN|nr:GntR family transcriptional regulator [Sphingobium boeckii]MBB5685012.1 DNA-binding GntR family transcriptional regulator [Sphingobium boeckii]